MAQLVKNPPGMRETWVQSLGWDDPLEKEMANPVFFDGQRSLTGYSPWGRKEPDMTVNFINSISAVLEHFKVLESRT